MSHQDLAEDAIEDEFMSVTEWVDPEVLSALTKAIYNSVKLKQHADVVMFAKSLVEEIDTAALKYTEKDYEDSRATEVSTSWANRRSAAHDVGHSAGDFA